MSNTVIKLENISKRYRLGLVGTNTLRGDITSWWYRMRGKEDPTLKIGTENKLDVMEGEYVWALRDINLKVKQGEVLGIIGKNGAGKSTLLKLLSRVTGPTTGQIKVKGRIASLLEVGTGFHPELTGRENIFLNGAVLGMKKAEIKSKLDEIVDFAGVAKYLDTPVKRYSSGMYVRLAFAVAAHLEPDILIVDEVLAVGDAEFQKKAIGKTKDVSTGQGRTVLFVSHNMVSVQQLCQAVVLLQNGSIVRKGSTKEIIDLYMQNNTKVVDNTNLEIAERSNKMLGKYIRITECLLLNSKSQPTHNLKFAEPFSIIIKAKAYTIIKDLSLGVRIDAHEDLALVSVFSEDKDLYFSLNKNQYLKQRIDFSNLKLAPGKYYLTIGIRQGKNGLDQIIKAFDFKISDVYYANKPHSGAWGYFLPDTTWNQIS